MQYPLSEKIGEPALFVGRERELKYFDNWLANIPKRLSKSRVIIARRKSGKTAFVQRIFNQLWSENGAVIPFYFEFGEIKIWFPNLAIDYYRTFASQYISFLERDEKMVNEQLSLTEIREYGLKNSVQLLVNDIDSMLFDKENRLNNSLWKTACSAPHRFAGFYEQRILVILDEFQYINLVYRDENCQDNPDESLPGSYNSLSESKLAPMLVTGSYANWLLEIMSRYLKGGRLKQVRFSPYLTEDEGLQAVYQYALFYEQAITNETALQINKLCMADHFFISCVILSDYEEKDLTTSEGVVNTVNYEISSYTAEMFSTWEEYIEYTVAQVNNRNAKNILLYLSKHHERYFTPKELQEELKLDLEVNEIHQQLKTFKAADLIQRGVSDIQFRGLQDGTLNLVLRNRFEKEIKEVAPDMKREFTEKIAQLTCKNKQLQEEINSYVGKFAEHILAVAMRNRKRFALSLFFSNVTDTTPLNLQKVKERVHIQREDGKNLELDIVADSSDERVVLVEVKKTQTPIGSQFITDFQEKVKIYQTQFPEVKVLAAYFSLGGFTKPARDLCIADGIGMAEEILEW